MIWQFLPALKITDQIACSTIISQGINPRCPFCRGLICIKSFNPYHHIHVVLIIELTHHDDLNG